MGGDNGLVVVFVPAPEYKMQIYLFPAPHWGYKSPDRLRVGIYSIFLKRWLQLFPRENIHIFTLEEYARSPLDYIEKHILPFLGLQPFTTKVRRMIRKSKANRLSTNVTMMNSTRQILNDFYEPYNYQLSEML